MLRIFPIFVFHNLVLKITLLCLLFPSIFLSRINLGLGATSIGKGNQSGLPMAPALFDEATNGQGTFDDLAERREGRWEGEVTEGGGGDRQSA